MLGLIGKLTNAAIGWAVPGFSAGSLYLVAGAVAVSLLGSVAYFTGAEGKSAAVATERASCELRISEDARASAETMTHLLEKLGKFEEDEAGKTPAQICAADPFCKRVKK